MLRMRDIDTMHPHDTPHTHTARDWPAGEMIRTALEHRGLSQ